MDYKIHKLDEITHSIKQNTKDYRKRYISNIPFSIIKYPINMLFKYLTYRRGLNNIFILPFALSIKFTPYNLHRRTHNITTHKPKFTPYYNKNITTTHFSIDNYHPLTK